MERLELRGVAARSTLRILVCAAFALTLFIVGQPADAAELTDVRVGKHQGYTRVVLELDSLTGYQVSEPKDGGDAVLRVELHASASERALTPKNALVKGVSIVPSGRSATVELSLSKAELQINEMILLSPPRLVFDLRDPTAVVAKPVAPAKKKTPVAKKKNTEPKVVAAKTAKPATPKKAEPKKATPPPASAAEPEKATAASALEVAKLDVSDAKAKASNAKAEVTDVVAQVEDAASAEAKSVFGDPTAAVANVADDSRLAERASLVKQALPAGAAISDGGAPKDAPTGLAALRAKNQGHPALASSPKASKPVVNRTTNSRKPIAIPASLPASTGDTSVMSKVKAMIPAGNLLYIIGGAVLALVALVFVLRRRGGNDDALSPVMAADHLGGGEDDLFASDDGGATEPVPTMPGHAAPAPKMSVTAPAAAAPASAAPSGGGNLETRVGELENRLQGLTDAREQIERQLSAQTEELRVQRAAIARTQRVVRSIGDGEEDTGATEPVPRAPGQAQA